MKSHRRGSFFSVASLCDSSSDWFTLLSKHSAHSILHSAHSPGHHGLVSCYIEGRFGRLAGSAASLLSQHVRSPHAIGEERTWQSSSKPRHRGQNSTTWTIHTGGVELQAALAVGGGLRVLVVVLAQLRGAAGVTAGGREGAAAAAGTWAGRRVLSSGDDGWLWAAAGAGGGRAAGSLQALLKEETAATLREGCPVPDF